MSNTSRLDTRQLTARVEAARICGACLLGMAMATLAGMLGTWAVLLPGVSTQFQAPQPVSDMAVAASVYVVAAVLFSLAMTRSVRRSVDLVWSSAVLLVDTFGLRPKLTRVAGVTAVGIAGAVVLYGLVAGMVPILPFPPPADADVRFEAVGEAPPWAAGAYFALVSSLFEELVFRGPLLAVAIAVTRTTWRRRTKTAVVAVVLVLTSVAFGWMHIDYSLANAVTWAVGGLVLGGLALACRSVWPAVLAHAGANFLLLWMA